MPHTDAVRFSQNAPRYLEKQGNLQTSTILSFLLAKETSEVWMNYEQLLLSCLRTGDDKSALLCLDSLIGRFGVDNERVMALRGLYQEVVAEDETALEKVLQEYENVVLQDPTNTPVTKRQIALLQSLSRPAEAIVALVELLETSPTDIEAWAELSDLYVSQAMYPQAIFCLEEILLVAPNAWNIHARLGEISYVFSYAFANDDASMEKLLLDATTDRLLETTHKDSKRESSTKKTTGSGDFAHVSLGTVNKLNEKATLNISRIVTRKSAGDPCYMDYDDSEIIAAKDLINGTASKQQR
ncbi:MAG: hypothetical protein Q9187_000357 [Circinaria calcarea]